MWLENFANFLYDFGNKLQGTSKKSNSKTVSKSSSIQKPTYTCKDTEHFAKNFKFDVGKDCIPGNILYFTDHNSKFEILSDISSMNEYLNQARKLGNVKKKYEICVDEISFDGPNASFIEVTPYTNSGKNSKFPITVKYYTNNYDAFEPEDNYFGELSYFEDGTIGKARLINWIGKTMLEVDLKTVGRELVISKILSVNANGEKKELYNINKNR